jgi:hypothetical protein
MITISRRAVRLKRRARRYPQKSAVIHFRITPETRRLLEEAAAEAGRTMSAECEHQLLRALSMTSRGQALAIVHLRIAMDALIAKRKRDHV